MQKILLIVVMTLMQISICWAESEIDLTTSEGANLLKKDWDCDWVSAGNPNFFKGEYFLNIKGVSGNTVSGNFENTFCSDPKEFQGEIKKGKFIWIVPGLPKPCDCGDFKAKAKLYRDSDNKLFMKGRYKGCAGFGTRTADSGKFHCK